MKGVEVRFGAVVACLLLLAGSFVFAAGTAESGPTKEKPLVITFADHNAIGSLLNQSAERFKEILEAETDGRVQVRYFPASQIGDQRANIESVQLGQIEMCYADPPYLSNLVPEFTVLGLPYIFRDFDHVEAAMDGVVGDRLEKMLLDEQKLKILGWYHVGFRDMMTVRTPLRSINDFKGMKFRSPEVPVFVNMFRAIGASPTPIPWGDVYTAMSTNIVDGMETTPEAMVSVKLYEVAKYVIRTNHMNTAMTIVVNNNFYQGLPADIKEAINVAIQGTQTWQRQAMVSASNDAFGFLESKGLEIIKIDTRPMQQAMKSVWVELTKGAPRAQELIDMLGNL